MSDPVESINLKEPVITVDMEYNEEESDLDYIGAGLPDFKKLADVTHKKTYVKCRSIRMGSYKVLMPSERVLFLAEGIRITIPPISDDIKEVETIDIPITKVVKILAHFGRCLPVFFVYVKPSVGRNIRKALKMTDPSGFYFDPCSSDESQTRITILPDKFMEASRTMFKDLYKSTTIDDSTIDQIKASSSTTQCILDEIDQKEANGILVRSSPDDLNIKQPAVNKKPQENKSPGLLSPKERGRGRDRGKAYNKSVYHQETKPFELLEVNLDNESYSNNKSYNDKKPSLQIGSSIKLSKEKCSIQRTLVDKKPSLTVGTRIKLVNEPIMSDEPIGRKEPVITADLEKDDDKDKEKESSETGDSLPDFGNLATESPNGVKGPYTTLKCRSLRMGSYKVLMPAKDVVFVPEGIRITIPPIIKGDKNEMVTIDIPMTKIVKILAHFGRSLPVFFVYVKSSVGRYIREALKMTDPSSFYFDPCSSDESQKRITILPDKFFESSRSIFKEIFNSASKTTTTDASSNTIVIYSGQSQVSTAASSHCLMEELDQKEANEILILSSPETLPMPNMNMATIRKHDEKESYTASTKKIKSEETQRSQKNNSIASTKKVKSEETQRSPVKNQLAAFRVKKQQRKKQQIIIRGEGNQPIILEVEEEDDEEEEDCDDPLAIEKTDVEEFESETTEPLPDLSIQASTPSHYRSIPPKNDHNIRINKVDTDTDEENLKINDWNKKMEQIKKEQIKKMEQNLEQIKKEKMEEINRNLAENTLPSQTPIFLSIPNINNSGQTVFQPKQNVQQKCNVVSPNKNGNGDNQIIRIKQEKIDDGNTILLPPIQLAQGGTPQFIMFLPGDKSVPGVPVNLLKPP